VSTSQPAPSSPTEPEPAAARPGIRWNDRVLVMGQNGSGKSVLLNHLAALYQCQVLLFDSKDEFSIPGVIPVYDISQADWSQRVIHVVDDSGDLRHTERVFAAAKARKAGRVHTHVYGLVVVVHELGDVCADTPGAAPPSVNAYIRKQRAHAGGLLAGSQRPRNIPRAARTEAVHFIAMVCEYDPEDVPIVAACLGMSVPEFEEALSQAAELGEHAYIWRDKRAKVTVIRPPLPPDMLAVTLAQGIDPADARARAYTPPEHEPEEGGDDAD
jgi:energy-coupling factor transporter ATP-binding protein EcfA2